ncbi:hypothetical protein [uncultured Variovorax sp.]|uniref:hypothetical protein n=1 Tax=uncultured Variovorax sp. TaxID=114708 RepID=UPI0025DB89B3|nr:hypothetical protein [uncultured Variovorax sp.]
MRQQVAQRVFSSPDSGSEQVIDRLNDRWLVSLTLPNRLHADAAVIEAFIGALRGMTNTVLLFHYVRKVPRGSMRGAPTAQAAAAGAQALAINTTAGATLRAGDMIGVSGLLLMAAADATANGSGVMVVPLVNCLRLAIGGGAPVTWDRPTAPFRLVSPTAVQYIPGYSPEASFDFVEAVG